MSIVEIARKFSVSPVTVSNALNHRKGVAKTLAEDIRDYASKVGYQPNHLARSLLSGRTGVIGVCLCVPPSTPWFGNLLCRLQHRLSEENYYANTIVIDPFEAGDRLKRESWALNFFRQIKAEAVLLGPLDAERYQLLEKELASLPRLVVFDALETLPASHIGLDMQASCRMALEHLHDAGHRRIGYIGLNRFDADSESSHTRYAAYRKFLGERGLEFHDQWVVRTPTSGPEPEMLGDLRRLLNSGSGVTALFCHDDAFGALALKAAAECGRKVPEDLSIIGFDDQPSAWLAHPGLTTIHFSLDDYVDKLVEFTLEAVNTPAGSLMPLRQYLEQPRLVERDSVARIRS